MNRRISKILIYTGIFIMLMAGAIYLTSLAVESEAVRGVVQRFGYLGIFLVGIVTGFNLIVPIPPVTFFPLYLESGLNFWGIIFSTALGLSIADSIGYFLGRVGREIILSTGERRVLSRLEKIKERYEYAPLAILALTASFAPFPNELIVIPLAFMGYRLRLILPILFIGHLIFNSIYATGVLNIFKIFSIV